MPVSYTHLDVYKRQAYAIGRWLKGPKLMPIASPNKTWSGFIGGIIVGTLAAGLYSILVNGVEILFGHQDLPSKSLFRTLTPWMGVGFILALSCQIGDLLESLVKRFFGVKDTSSLIPGHGGLLDRLDGHFAVALMLQIFVLIPQTVSYTHLDVYKRQVFQRVFNLQFKFQVFVNHI